MMRVLLMHGDKASTRSLGLDELGIKEVADRSKVAVRGSI
jgi:hypothetical protein